MLVLLANLRRLIEYRMQLFPNFTDFACSGPLPFANLVTHSTPSLQRYFRLYIPFLGIAKPQPQFPHSCVFERFIYSQDQSTYFLQQNRQTHRGNI
jgi:hypothetical protein